MRTAVVCLASEAYRAWTEVQSGTVARWAPEAEYIVLWEEELRKAPGAPVYEHTGQFLFACRYKAIRELLAKYDQVIHVGADVYFTDRFLEPLRAYKEDCLLTPHILGPPTRPITDYVKTGLPNSDFQVWRRSQEVFAFLDWMTSELATNCIDNTSNGQFFDQTLLQFAPYFINSCKIYRHPGFNVAYYNLHERTVSNKDGCWYVNGMPLYCFQFSGYEPEFRPFSLTKFKLDGKLVTRDILTLIKEFYNEYESTATRSRIRDESKS